MSSKFGKLKYPTKISNKLYPIGTTVQLYNASDDIVQKEWKDIQRKDKSNQIAVRFLDRETITIMNITQIEF